MDQHTIETFRDNLLSEDVEIRMEALTSIPILLQTDDAPFIGKIVKCLQRCLFEEEELDLFATDQLPMFTQVLHGEDVPHVYPIFHLILDLPELSIREKGIASFIEIINSNPQNDFIPFIEDLLKQTIYSKISAAKLIFCLPESNSFEKKIEIIKMLINEKFPPIRKAIANNIGRLENVPSEILEKLIKDPIDAVHVGFSRSLPLLCKRIENVKFFKMVAEDPSWHVRYVCATNIGKCLDNIPGEELSEEVQDIALKLLEDPEDQVRAMAASHLSEITKKLKTEVVVSEKFLQKVRNLSKDPIVHVRSSLASSITQIAPQIGKPNSQNYLFGIIKQCLQDNNTEVRLNIITTLDSLYYVMVLNELSADVMVTVKRLAEDSNWRCRLQTIELIPELIRLMKENENELVKIALDGLKDKVYSIRMKAIDNVKKLMTTQQDGVTWIKQKMFPQIIGMASSKLYHERIICMNCLSQIIHQFSAETITTSIIPVLKMLITDKIPNVRFNAIKTFVVIFPLVTTSTIQNRIKPLLMATSDDKDPDVIAELNKALDNMNQFLC